jgi:hypothetical protein
VEYNHLKQPICHICGRAFKNLLTHAYQKHGTSAYDYKKEFELDLYKGIIAEETREKHRVAVKRDYDKVVVDNLLAKGKETRFTKGCEGRTRDKVSLQTLNELKNRFKKESK